jgi:hypothetical protein
MKSQSIMFFLHKTNHFCSCIETFLRHLSLQHFLRCEQKSLKNVYCKGNEFPVSQKHLLS